MTDTQTPTVTPSQFTNNLAKISVAQILKSTGFKSSKSTALDTLTRITTLFLHQLSSAARNPTLKDVVSALENLNFPLDFSLPNLTLFLADSDHLPPFPHRRIPKPEAAAVVSEGGCDSTGSRGSNIPSWLSAFPSISNCSGSSNDDDENGECKWEEICVKPRVAVKELGKDKVLRKVKRGLRGNMVFARRERLKFRLVGKRKAKAGNVDDLELRNGVCRGGKRVCLVKWVNGNRFFNGGDDDDDDDDDGK